MSVDPTDPDTFEDAYEEEPEGGGEFEAPSVDAAEQQADLLRQHERPITGRDEAGDPEVDPADREEQSRVVELNEDEYR